MSGAWHSAPVDARPSRRARSGGGAQGYAMKYGLVSPRTPQNNEDTFMGRMARAGKSGEEE